MSKSTLPALLGDFYFLFWHSVLCTHIHNVVCVQVLCKMNSMSVDVKAELSSVLNDLAFIFNFCQNDDTSNYAQGESAKDFKTDLEDEERSFILIFHLL